MQAGFIGLGTMGASMAANLQKGLKARGDTLVVHDIRREAAARHVKDGAIWADSPQAVAEQSEVIFTSLPGPPEFEAVAAGLLAGIRKGTAYFDLTTNSPTVVRKAHEAFAAKGVHLFDAPVSGGPRGAASGKLAIWCGGDEDVFEQWKPVLDMIGDAAQYIGPIGGRFGRQAGAQLLRLHRHRGVGGSVQRRREGRHRAAGDLGGNPQRRDRATRRIQLADRSVPAEQV